MGKKQRRKERKERKERRKQRRKERKEKRKEKKEKDFGNKSFPFSPEEMSDEEDYPVPPEERESKEFTNEKEDFPVPAEDREADNFEGEGDSFPPKDKEAFPFDDQSRSDEKERKKQQRRERKERRKERKGGLEAAKSDCKDDTSCQADWSAHCTSESQFFGYMKIYCPKTCGFC